MAVDTIEVKELFDLYESSGPLEVIDVRTPEEYNEVHATIVSKHIPLDQFEPSSLAGVEGKMLYFICKSGGRSMQAATLAEEAGFKCTNVEGGTMAWAALGLPTKNG
tara:strand:+ start:595 stop:915 length:321 start_codon:yes stop_codon:yes gene_type:complete